MLLDYSELFHNKLDKKQEANLKLIIKNCEKLYVQEGDDILRHKVIADIIYEYIETFYTKNLVETIPISTPVFECPITKMTYTTKAMKCNRGFFEWIDKKILEAIKPYCEKLVMSRISFYNYMKLLDKSTLENRTFYTSGTNINETEGEEGYVSSAAMENMKRLARSFDIQLEDKIIPFLNNNEILIHRKEKIGLLYYPYSFIYGAAPADKNVWYTIRPLHRFHLEPTKYLHDAYTIITIEDE